MAIYEKESSKKLLSESIRKQYTNRNVLIIFLKFQVDPISYQKRLNLIKRKIDISTVDPHV